jgi:hypothetical protein
MRAPINGKGLVRVFVGGKEVPINHPVYGYEIVPDENRLLTDDQFYKIRFKRPIRMYRPMVEVCYVTLQTYCLKCGGMGALNDFKKANTGSLVHVVNGEKLAQRVQKIVLTSRCPFYPQFTCRIKDYIARKNVATTEIDVSSELVNALHTLKTIQSAQRGVQVVTPHELLKDVTSVVTKMPDPISLVINASVSSYGGSIVPVNLSLTSSRNLV